MESIKDKIHVIYEKYSKKPVNTLKRVVALMMAVFLAFSSYTGNWSVLGQKVYADDGEAETKSVDITIDGIPADIKDEELTQGNFLLENAGRMYTGGTVNIQQDAESQIKKYTVTFKGIDEADVKADGANPVIDFYKDNAEQTTYYEGWKENVNAELKVAIPVDTDSNAVKYDKYKKVDITINDSDNIGLEASDFAVAIKTDSENPDNVKVVGNCILSGVNKTSLVYSALVKNPETEEYKVDVTINGKSADNFEIEENKNQVDKFDGAAEKNITDQYNVKRKNADADYIIKVEDKSGKVITDAVVKLSYKTSDGNEEEVTTTNKGDGTYTAGIKKGVSYKTVVKCNNYIQVSSNDYGEKNNQSETVTMEKKTYKVKVNDNQNVSFKVTENDNANENSNVNDQSLEFGKNYQVEISSTVKKITGVSAKCNDKEVCSDTKIENNKWTGTLNISDSQPDEYDNDMEVTFNVTTSEGKIIIDDSTEVDNYNANSTMSIKSEPEAKSWKIEQKNVEDNYEEITGEVIKIDTADNKLTISPQAEAGNKYKITAYADDNKKEAIASKEITISDYEQISLDNKNDYYKVVNDNNKEDVVNVTDNNTDIYYSASDVKIIAQKNASYKWVPSGSESTFDSVEFVEMEAGNNDKNTVATLSASTSGTLYVYEKLNDGKVYKGSIQIVLDKEAPEFTSVKVNKGEEWTQSKKIELTVSDNLPSDITDGVILNNSIYYVIDTKDTTDKTDISFLKNGDTYKNYYSLSENDKKTINSLNELKLNSLSTSLEVQENCTIHFIAIDRVGNINVKNVTVENIDTTAPEISASINDNDSWAQFKTIELTVTDSQSKVDALYVSESKFTQDLKNVTKEMLDKITVSKTVNGGNKEVTINKDGTAEVKISQEANDQGNNYYFYAIDNAGNVQKQEVTVKNIDTTEPEISADIKDNDNWSQSKTVSLKVTDNLSGVKKLYVSESPFTQDLKDVTEEMLDGITVSKTVNGGNKEVTINKDGTAEVKISQESESKNYYFYAIDNAGNVQKREVTVKNIDTTKPNISVIEISDSEKWTQSKTISLKVSDDLSGLDKLYVSGEEVTEVTEIQKSDYINNGNPVVDVKDGTATVTVSEETDTKDYSRDYYFYAIDKVGKMAKEKVTVKNIDTTKPNISDDIKISDSEKWTQSKTISLKVSDDLSGLYKLYVTGEKISDEKITDEKEIPKSDNINNGNPEVDVKDGTAEVKISQELDDNGKIYYFYAVDNAGNILEKEVKVTKIDKTIPEIISIKYENNIMTKHTGVCKYHIFSIPQMNVVINVTDNLSGVKSLSYVEKDENNNIVSKLQEVEEKQIVRKDETEVKFTLPVKNDFKGTIEFTATDNSNNSTTKTTEGIVVESDKKHETSSVTIKPDDVNGKNGFYNKDFNVKFNAKDSYSYIKSIVYKIGDTEYTVDGTETNKFADSDVESWENEVTIEAGKHNSNEFPVSITMTDNAGHKTEASMSYKIDTISPKVTLEYYDADGNKIEDLNENTRKYINKGVKVKVTVDDYNFTDNSKDEYSDADYFTLGVTKNGTTTDKALVFTKNTDEASKRIAEDKTEYYTWSAEYILTEDADYSINVSKCMDRAGNVFDGSTVKTAQITVDKTEPQISITYDNNNPSNTIDNYGYYNAARTATIKIEELSFDNSNTKVILTKNGEKVDITSDFKGNSEYSTRDNKDSYKTYEMKYLFKDDADYTITVESTDKAVNQDKYDKIDKFTVDKTAPNISITYDKNEPSTFNNHDYYKTARTATIKIEELSFDNSNTKVILTKNGKKVDITSDFKEKSGYNKRGNDTGDSYKTYEMKYTFNDDADYTITVTSVDYAKNQGKYDGTDKFTIDKTAPDISVVYDSQAPANNYNNHDYYNVEKTVTITVKDLSFSADKDKVKVMLKKDGVDTQLASDFKEIAGYTTWENSNDTYKTYQMTYVIKDDADYAFTVECTDLAGNEDNYDRVDYFTIDKTSPVINVEYDNNTPSNIYDGHNYYNEQRTATITIDELSFNNDDVKVLVTKNNQTVAVQPAFNQIAGYTTRADSGDTYNTYQMTYAFDTDGDYTITVEYTDLAKNVDTYDRTDNFTVDMNGADIYVTYDNNQPSNTVDGYDYYNVTRTATVTIEELSFRNEDAHVIVTKNGNAVQVTPQFKETAGYQVRDNGNSYRTYQMTYLIDGDGDYTFTVDYTDLAGNADTYDRTDSFTIDKTRPEIRVTYDTDSPSNTFNNHDYYNVTRQATIAIDELSFNNSDVNVIVTKNNETVIVTPSFEEVTGLQTKDNGDTYRTYQMTYPFTEDADYTITVDYTDLAANTDEYDRTDSFTIDRSRPEIEVTYDNNTPSNSEGGKDYYNTQRTATVTVRELSFNNNDVQFIVTRDGASTVESPAFTEVAGLQTKDNGDTYRTYEMTYTFNDNFDYTVTADYTDLAGNSDNYDNVDEFTYDDIKPVISIELTGTSLESNEYFNDSRTATITVEEHNFNEAEFQLHMTATDNGTEIAAPSISGFAANGDTHTATIVFDRDEEITISADYTDMAGNVADTLNEQKFVIDLTDPEIEIEQDSLIENKTYGKDEAAMPKILITDTNFSQNGVSIQVEGRKNGLIQAAVASETVPNGLLYTVSGIDEDDVYTLTVNVTDMSGREQQYTRQFHVNRNGSSYAFGNALQTMNKTYVKAVGEDLYIVETNVDALTANKVTYSRGGMIAELKPETDYTVAVAENAYGWQEYTYRISQKVFSEEGEYKVILSSTDTAGNNSDNSSKEQAISFVVDNTPPTQVITGVEDDGVYTQDSLDVTIEVYDNVAVNSVDITLNGVKTTYNEEQITKENGKVYVNIPSDTKKQTLEVACIDYAGNEAQHQTYSFTVSTNAFIAFKARYLSKPGFWVAVGCVAVALAGAVTGTVVIRRRKKNVADN